MAVATPARAQMGGGSSGGGDGPHINLLADQPSKSPEEREAEEARQKAYKESLRKIPDSKASNDPWGSVRSDAPKAPPAKSTASTKAKTKTGNIAN
jgi:hypothetical protein